MAQSISEVAVGRKSAKVAQQSLTAAEKGAQSVQNQISGMNEIAQIRTRRSASRCSVSRRSKSAKSSSGISDLTEQTNISR
jgi:twitching motility protein PilJ